MSLSRLFLAARLVLIPKPHSPSASSAQTEQGSVDSSLAIHATSLATSNDFGQPHSTDTPPALGDKITQALAKLVAHMAKQFVASERTPATRSKIFRMPAANSAALVRTHAMTQKTQVSGARFQVTGRNQKSRFQSKSRILHSLERLSSAKPPYPLSPNPSLTPNAAIPYTLVSFALLLVALVLAVPISAQSTSATLNGQITDPSGKVVPGTAVSAVNIDTNITKGQGSGVRFQVSGLAILALCLLWFTRIRRAAKRGVLYMSSMLHSRKLQANSLSPDTSPLPETCNLKPVTSLAFAATLLAAAFLSVGVYAQSTSATLNGQITDPAGKVVPGTAVSAVNIDTNISYPSKTNETGIYVIPNLPPGRYRLLVSHDGFKQINKTDITLNVQDDLEQNFSLEVGSTSESVTVEGSGVNINTTDGSVSTVIDRQFVENMPLNGRSFQDLILLTPGVIPISPQIGGSLGSSGEFSINGSRTESNYYTVDGVSANIGIAPGQPAAAGTAGSVALSTALGTTQALTSVDSLQEFRVESSSYSAEFGRNLGGQISIETKSGTNEWHGSAFDFIRNSVFDANDWFTDYFGKTSAAERQNDFGATLGGPVQTPHFYNGKGRTFFFSSYEGLRLTQPQPASVSYAPTAALRGAASSPLQNILQAFPLPNCPPSATNCSSDLGNGLGDYIGTWSNPSRVDNYSVRLDHKLSDRVKAFFHFNGTPSNTAQRLVGAAPASGYITSLSARSYTFGSVQNISGRATNDFRLNFATNSGKTDFRIYPIGGSQPTDLASGLGISESASPTYAAYFVLAFPGYTQELIQYNQTGTQRQWNLVDSMKFLSGKHVTTIGIDFRRLAPQIASYNPLVEFLFFSSKSVQDNSGSAFTEAIKSANPLYKNFSAFLQDEWHLSSRLNLSMGIRWELNPAPSATDGRIPYTVRESSSGSLFVAPRGTPLWQTTWFNLAPRLGGAFVIHDRVGWETVFRAGGGVFFDSGQQEGSAGFQGPGFSASKFYSQASLPLLPSQLSFTIPQPPMSCAGAPPPTGCPYGTIYAFPEHLQLPYSLQWNASLQQALNRSQSVSLSYVGSRGSRLLEDNQVNEKPTNPDFSTVVFYQNGLTSDYDALQAQFQRAWQNGIGALASYSWSHCRDYGSQNSELPYQRGNCDFDVRSYFSTAVSFDSRIQTRRDLASAMLAHWGFDERFTARTAFPVLLNGRYTLNTATGQYFESGLDVVQGKPIYLVGSQNPGGKRINPDAFALPASGNPGNAPRNFVRGFNAWQFNSAVRREFPIHEQFNLEFRAEAFNVFNHPTFGTVNTSFGNATFGQATGTLASSSGVLNALYQQGGPRSLQFALKLKF